jgi:serine/threonine protein kinase
VRSFQYARRIVKSTTRSKWSEYAVKIISISTIKREGYERSVNREIAVLRNLSHPGIARLISSFRFRDGAYLVLEHCSGGDLHTLVTSNSSLDESSARFVCGEVVAGLASIHNAGFVYGDLKPENIMITEAGHVKIGDFGGCR